MSKNNSKTTSAKKWTILALILFLLVAIIGGTYTRYTNSASGNATIDIAKWSVKINNTDMKDITGDLTVPLEYVANAKVSANKIAPSGSATFTLVIDPSGSEVAIDYSLSVGAITGLTDSGSKLELTSVTYTVQGGSAQTITPGGTAVEFTEALADFTAGKTVTVVGTVTWDNDSDNRSAADTANGWADVSPTASVSITAKQSI